MVNLKRWMVVFITVAVAKSVSKIKLLESDAEAICHATT